MATMAATTAMAKDDDVDDDCKDDCNDDDGEHENEDDDRSDDQRTWSCEPSNRGNYWDPSRISRACIKRDVKPMARHVDSDVDNGHGYDQLLRPARLSSRATRSA